MDERLISGRVLNVLEFTKIREALRALTRSEMGREYAAGLHPFNTLSLARAAMEDTSEAETLYFKIGASPIPEFSDIRPALSRAKIGAVLGMGELLEVGFSLRAARGVRASLAKDKDEETYSRIKELAAGIIVLRGTEDEIFRCITSPEEMSDNASGELASIRRQMRIASDRVREKLNSYLHSSQFVKYLQEPVVTIRNNRYVLPVRVEYRQSVPGLVHDQSASGQTLFIEPMSVVELGNEARRLQAAEQQEIERILAELTAMVDPEVDFIVRNLELMAELDFIFAKAALSKNMRAIAPELNAEGRFRINRGRHPLIDAAKVVPVSIRLGQDFNTLVITGPNTGGKTVSLKTVGLFTLMASAGLHVPADTGTELAVFSNVFADIGDEQSIEQSLSTFSSHMTNIVRILSDMDEDSLVLFDELGAGTDPTEGAALAISILETLHARGIRSIATTHYSELKEFALTRPGVENASVEFNVETLSPTYRLSIGVPGKSNAFEISKRLGLPDIIIDKAREHLSHDQIRFEDVIANAEYHRQIAEKERAIAEEARQEMVKVRDELDRQRSKLETQKQDIIGKAKEDAKRIIMNAREQMERTAREMKKLSAAAQPDRDRALQKQRSELRDSLAALGEDKKETERLIDPPKDLKAGELVKLIHLDKEGVVLIPPDGKGEVSVQVGIMKLSAHISNLRRVERAESHAPARQGGREMNLAMRTAKLEIDLRGMTTGEALSETDKFLDEATLAGLGEVSIIHGKGTGALRAAITSHLKGHPQVSESRLGKFGEGEGGVTIVRLK